MSRDILEENNRIRTGNRFIQEAQGNTGVFPRDIDALFVQYENLRNKVYSVNATRCRTQAERNELRSYIDEEFIKISKEYEINGEVDFPYYVKTKLNSRVRGTFITKINRDSNREPLGATDEEVELIMDKLNPSIDQEDLDRVVKRVAYGVHLTDMEKDILTHIATTDWKQSELAKLMSKTYKVSQSEVKESIGDIIELVRIKLGQ